MCSVQALTQRQEEILLFIKNYTQKSGFPPAVRDIGKHFKLYPATVHDHLRALERKGHLYRKPNQSRSLVLVEPDMGPPDPSPSIAVPIVGRVAAGSPMLAEENLEDRVPLPARWARPGSFLLRVAGDSMKDAHILDGDYVLVRPRKTASNGEIVVALLENEATVKRFYKYDWGLELRPENPDFSPIQIQASEATGIRIVGTVDGVLRF